MSREVNINLNDKAENSFTNLKTALGLSTDAQLISRALAALVVMLRYTGEDDCVTLMTGKSPVPHSSTATSIKMNLPQHENLHPKP